MATDELKIGLVGVGTGGPSSYHARSFSSIFNGYDPDRTPNDWPVHDLPVDGGRITTVWDEDVEAARRLAEVFSIDRVASSMDDVVRDVDAVIVVDDITMTHQKKALYFVEEGVPTFIDKPLSDDPEEALGIVEAAEARGTLVMSTSALRFARETEEARAAIKDIGRVTLATASCQGQYMGDDAVIHYGIHPLELAYSVLGSGARSVYNVGLHGGHLVRVDFDDRVLMLMVFPEIAQAFKLDLFGENGAVTITVADWDYFYWNMLDNFVRMVREKTVPVPLRETLEVIRVLAAAKESLATGREIQLTPA